MRRSSTLSNLVSLEAISIEARSAEVHEAAPRPAKKTRAERFAEAHDRVLEQHADTFRRLAE